MSGFTLGGSSIGTFADCEGRWAIENVKEIKDRFVLPSDKVPGVGSVFGVIGHAAIKNMLTDKRNFGFVPDVDLEMDKATAWFNSRLADGLKMDDTTFNAPGAIRQLEKVIREAAFNLVPRIEPEHIESEIGFKLAGDEWLQILCHPDVITRSEWIEDHKLSRFMSNHNAQGGTYSLSYRNVWDKWPKGFRINWIQRVGESVVQPDLKVIDLDLNACVEVASTNIRRIAQALKAYDSDRSETKKYWHFNFNGNSKYCTKKTCKAWGKIEFCNQWRPE